MYFDELPLSDEVLDALWDMHFDVCPPVQEKAIPPLLDGHDVIACAQTGTGKTAAYILPLLTNLQFDDHDPDKLNAIIMAPTRELAQQIDQQMQGFGYYVSFSSVPVYGGNGIMDYVNTHNDEDCIAIGRVGAYCGCVYKSEGKCWVSDNAISVSANGIVNTDFLYYLMTTLDFHHHHIGGAQPLMTQDIIGDFVVVIPSLPIQNQIVSILKSLDDKIEVNRRINDNLNLKLFQEAMLLWTVGMLKNDNLEQQAQALFKSWFVDFEPFKDGEFVESEVGRIPKGWRVGSLSEIANITMGQSPSGSSYNLNGEGDVFYQGRAEFGFRFPKRNMYTTEAKRFAEVNSVLFSVRAPVGDVNVAEERCCIGRGLASIKSNNGNSSFILYLMQFHKPVFDRFNGEGTVFGSINKNSLENFKIIIPLEESINKFQKIAGEVDKQIKNLENESTRLNLLRETLLPRLMSGEVKVNDLTL